MPDIPCIPFRPLNARTHRVTVNTGRANKIGRQTLGVDAGSKQNEWRRGETASLTTRERTDRKFETTVAAVQYIALRSVVSKFKPHFVIFGGVLLGRSHNSLSNETVSSLRSEFPSSRSKEEAAEGRSSAP